MQIIWALCLTVLPNLQATAWNQSYCNKARIDKVINEETYLLKLDYLLHHNLIEFTEFVNNYENWEGHTANTLLSTFYMSNACFNLMNNKKAAYKSAKKQVELLENSELSGFSNNTLLDFLFHNIKEDKSLVERKKQLNTKILSFLNEVSLNQELSTYLKLIKSHLHVLELSQKYKALHEVRLYMEKKGFNKKKYYSFALVKEASALHNLDYHKEANKIYRLAYNNAVATCNILGITSSGSMLLEDTLIRNNTLKVSKANNMTYLYTSIMANIGISLSNGNRLDEAIKILKNCSLDYNKNLINANRQDSNNYIIVETIIANIEIKKSMFLTAIDRLKKIKPIIPKESLMRLLSVHELLAISFNEINEKDSAVFHFEKTNSFYAKLYRKERKEAAKKQKTQAENNLLKVEQQEKKIQTLELNSKLRKNKSLLLIVSFISLFAILFMVLIFQRKKKKDLINHINYNQDILAAKEEERYKISRKLHDNIGGLISISTQLLKSYKKSEYKKPELFNTALENIQSATDEVRNISHKLANPVLLKKDFSDQIKGLFKGLELTDRINAQLKLDIKAKEVEQSIKENLLAIIQECANNTLKHSNASKINLNLVLGKNELFMLYKDNGKSSNSILTKEGMGIKLIRTRASEMGLNIDMNMHKGFYIELKK